MVVGDHEQKVYAFYGCIILKSKITIKKCYIEHNEFIVNKHKIVYN